MQTVGDYLKAEREARNISLSEVARLTKISQWYLDYLEKDDYEKIPQGPYIKGYISSYATYIGVNAEEALKRYNSRQDEENKTKVIQPEIPQAKKRQMLTVALMGKRNRLVLSFAMVLLAAFGLYHLLSQNQKKTHGLADLQEPKDKGLQPTLTTEDDDSAASNKLDRFEKNKKAHIDSQSTSTIAQPISEMIPAAQRLASNQITSGENISEPGRKSQKSMSPPLTTVAENPTKATRAHPSNTIKVLKATACKDVKDRNPFGAGDSIQWSMDRVYVWNLIQCESPPSSIRHVYYFNGQKVSDVSLQIGSPLWRTWSYKKLSDKRFIGSWRVDITSAEGDVLQSIFFEVH